MSKSSYLVYHWTNRSLVDHSSSVCITHLHVSVISHRYPFNIFFSSSYVKYLFSKYFVDMLYLKDVLLLIILYKCFSEISMLQHVSPVLILVRTLSRLKENQQKNLAMIMWCSTLTRRIDIQYDHRKMNECSYWMCEYKLPRPVSNSGVCGWGWG